MKRASLVPVLVGSMIVVAACPRPRPGNLGRVIQVSPGMVEVGAEDLQDGIRITFDRPVGPPDLVGQPIAGPALVFQPPVAGQARWLDTRTLAFFPKTKLEPS